MSASATLWFIYSYLKKLKRFFFCSFDFTFRMQIAYTAPSICFSLFLSSDMAFIIAMLLASLNSCCNPWIYMFFAGHLFRDLMRRLFCCCRQYLTDSSCNCDRDHKHKSYSSVYVIKNTSSQRSLTHTSSTGGPGHWRASQKPSKLCVTKSPFQASNYLQHHCDTYCNKFVFICVDWKNS